MSVSWWGWKVKGSLVLDASFKGDPVAGDPEARRLAWACCLGALSMRQGVLGALPGRAGRGVRGCVYGGR